MKASVYSKYGPPDVLVVTHVEKPVPADNEVLVCVKAATVNRTDCAMLRAKPFVMRFVTGLFKPRKPVTGTDFAGVVEAVGKAVKSFSTGDKVFGFGDNGIGSHAQYLAFPEDRGLVTMPDNISFEEAVASAEGAHYAFNMINKVNIKSGQKALVNGASGAIGSATVQLLKSLGVEVVAVCGTKNIDLIKSLGAERVIDYTREDFTKDDQKYTLVLDTVGKSTFGQCKPLLLPGGAYISSELGPGGQNIFFAISTRFFGDKKVIFPIPLDVRRSLNFVKGLIEEGKYKAVIDRRYPLENIADAFRYVETGEKTGNVIVNFE